MTVVSLQQWKIALEGLRSIADRPCFAVLLGEDTRECECPCCTAKRTLAAIAGVSHHPENEVEQNG